MEMPFELLEPREKQRQKQLVELRESKAGWGSQKNEQGRKVGQGEAEGRWFVICKGQESRFYAKLVEEGSDFIN